MAALAGTLIFGACATPPVPEGRPPAPGGEPPPALPSVARPEAAEVGLASWYGRGDHGKRTANGEPFDMEAFTAAHRSLPFGTWVRVTHLATRRTVMVRINDRGPWVEGRVIDLSRRAAQALGILWDGVARVRLEVVRSP
ncbi:MAG: septal ring lytic transglycosylase RlpA family protein [Candidatus Methylomirabilales bacterium]